MREAHVLEIIGKRPVGGVGTVMLNYQRHMNMERVQMDYLIFGEQEETFDKEVKKLGSRVYTYPALSGRQMRQTRKYFEQFFSEHHSEYDIVHLHAPYIAFLCLPVAAKYGISHRIVHSHATVYAESKGKAVRNRMLWSISQKYIPIGSDARRQQERSFWQKRLYCVKNAICCDEYAYNETARNEIRTQYQAKDKLVIGNVGRFSQQKTRCIW